jgi:hypothetical protein
VTTTHEPVVDHDGFHLVRADPKAAEHGRDRRRVALRAAK